MPRARSRRDTVGSRVADLGELAVLARIVERVGAQDGAIVVGIGDDTAALRVTPGMLTLLTTDALVEDVHFRRATSSPADVGWKALAINASDIAAMGGRSRHAVVSLMLPADLDAAWVDGLYDGLLMMAASCGVTVVGGNLAQAPVIIVDVALLGEVEPDRLIRRDGARAGDLLAVTGTLGRAAAGLVALTEHLADGAVCHAHAPDRAAEDHATAIAPAIAAQRRPEPRLAAGRVLAGAGGVHAMIDLSDGLALDLWRLCEASGVGVRLDAARLPVDPCVPVVAMRSGRSALQLAIAGGEDYELLFAVAERDAGRVLARLQAETGLAATVIGQVLPLSAGRSVVVDGAPRPLDASGWTHFRPGGSR
ncbi:MAG: thiamine-phosphate kinase [Armatimonadota bacterium]|nr:thiamine-phosphate kinase [Armatimonadota bacterium]